jgi:hypothetical protein
MTFSTWSEYWFCVKYYSFLPSADHFDVWHYGSVTSSSPSNFSPKLYWHAKKWLRDMETSCYIDHIIVPSWWNLRQHYISLLPKWGRHEGHNQNGCTGSQGPSYSRGARWNESGKMYPQWFQRSDFVNVSWPLIDKTSSSTRVVLNSVYIKKGIINVNNN